MATLVEQLYSQNHWADIDGAQTIWNFTFAGGYIFKEHVLAYYLDAAGSKIPVAVGPDAFIGEFQVQITPPIPASAQRFVIYRSTPKDLPLVDFDDGAQVTEANLDRIARQAIFVAAEVLDGASTSGLDIADILSRMSALDALLASLNADEYGYKMLKQVAYTGASTVTLTENGRSHYKTDGTAVTVPNTLPVTFLSTIVNDSDGDMTVTFDSATAILQGSSDYAGTGTWLLAPRSLLSITKVANGRWFISGNVS